MGNSQLGKRDLPKDRPGNELQAAPFGRIGRPQAVSCTRQNDQVQSFLEIFMGKSYSK
jgi:hypothetical protein